MIRPGLFLFVALSLSVFSFGFLLAKGYYTAEMQKTTGSDFSDLPSAHFSSAANILAVTEGDGEGVLGKVIVSIVPGNGNLLLNVGPFVEPDTQSETMTALAVAETYARKNIGQNDVIVSFSVPEEIGLVGGPSAGAATAVALVAALENRTVRDDVALTGTVDERGTIGPVGGILEKAQAAEQHNLRTLLVPEGELIVIVYERRESSSVIPFMSKVAYVPRVVNLQSYAREHNWKLQIEEVATVADAASVMIR